jgi:predicted nicotinamide N-methyase
MEDNDFLWECALIPTDVNSTLFLVPGILDEPKNFLPNERLLKCTTFLPERSGDDLKMETLSISVVEIRGNGVLDTVGGEIWEASLLLCAYILLHPQLFIHTSVLELGSGLGLPGFLLAELQSLVASEHEREVCLSDNDPRCVENLMNLVQQHYGGETSNLIHSSNENGKVGIRVQLSAIDLDWSAYVKQSNFLAGDINDEAAIGLSDSQEITLSNQRFQVLMGSALCYSPYHICLADTVKHFLDGDCNEVVIIQIGDRAGFDLFLIRLASLEVTYTIEEVSSSIYETAQMIGESQCLTAHSESDSSALSHDEGEVRIEKKFFFPPDIVRAAISCSRARNLRQQISFTCFDDETHHSGDLYLGLTTSAISRNLIKTDRESFKLVRVKAVDTTIKVPSTL